ncbi:hypothetical protein FGRMN_1230 [Fusarium graminum]|nr:hypothetical protein FGRMN_1230 [Fusarium graminum]
MGARSLIVLDVGLGLSVAGLSFKEVITNGQILSLDLDQLSLKSVQNPQSKIILPDGVVYSRSQKKLFVTNMGIPSQNDGSVISMNLNGSEYQAIIAPGHIHTPKQLAIDEVNNKLYYADREGMRIMRSNIDGTGLEILHQSGIGLEVQDQRNWCVGIAVSPQLATVYWTQKGPSKGGQGRIFCARINETTTLDPTCLLEGLPEPIDLHIDHHTNTLYWTDRGELPYGNTFNRVQLDHSGTALAKKTPDAKTGLLHEILTQNLDEAIGLSHDEEARRWYISDMGGTIWSMDENGRDKKVVYQDKERAFTGIAFIA